MGCAPSAPPRKPSDTPLLHSSARAPFLRAVCAAAEGTATMRPSSDTVCIRAMLCDRARFAVLGGREHAPRSLGSLYAAYVTLSLGSRFTGAVLRRIETRELDQCFGCAFWRNGTALLASDTDASALRVYSVETGDLLQVVGSWGSRKLQFRQPKQVCASADDVVFVADSANHRIQVLTPRLSFHRFIGEKQLRWPVGVGVSDTVVAVAEFGISRVSVFTRRNGALLRRIGSEGMEDGQLFDVHGLCVMPGSGAIAVTDRGNDRIGVFSSNGDLIHNLYFLHHYRPMSVACTSNDELIVTLRGDDKDLVFMFQNDCDVPKVLPFANVTVVAAHSGVVAVHQEHNARSRFLLLA